MKIHLTDWERQLCVNILAQIGYTITNNRKDCIKFKTNSEQLYTISNTSIYDYHITVDNIGDTYGTWPNIAQLLVWINENPKNFEL